MLRKNLFLWRSLHDQTKVYSLKKHWWLTKTSWRLNESMTLKDCDFLRSVYLNWAQHSTMLNLSPHSTEQIQDLGIAFKVLDGKDRYNIFCATHFPTLFSSSWSCTNRLQLFAMLVINEQKSRLRLYPTLKGTKKFAYIWWRTINCVRLHSGRENKFWRFHLKWLLWQPTTPFWDFIL